MLKLKDFLNANLQYYYSTDKIIPLVEIKKTKTEGYEIVPKAQRVRIPKGLVVAIGPGIVGWSMCNDSEKIITIEDPEDKDSVIIESLKGDSFNKELGIHIALNRANYAATIGAAQREIYYENVPQTLRKLFNKMMEKSYTKFSESDCA